MSKGIIILGNGFDLDLGLKTSYSDLHLNYILLTTLSWMCWRRNSISVWVMMQCIFMAR